MEKICTDFRPILGKIVSKARGLGVPRPPGLNLTLWFMILLQTGKGAVHILRQPLDGGEGVSQMLTNADERG